MGNLTILVSSKKNKRFLIKLVIDQKIDNIKLSKN